MKTVLTLSTILWYWLFKKKTDGYKTSILNLFTSHGIQPLKQTVCLLYTTLYEGKIQHNVKKQCKNNLYYNKI